MAQYRFTQRYRSSYGQGDVDDVVELSELDAANINRDSPGTLVPFEPATEEELDTRAIEDAPNNRQVTTARNRAKA